MATSTPMQALPIPEETDVPDVAADIVRLANAIEKKLAGVYTTTADRDTKVTAGGGPINGQIAVCTAVNKVFAYLGSAWVQIYPQAAPTIYNGTTAPDNTVGANGDLYVRY